MLSIFNIRAINVGRAKLRPLKPSLATKIIMQMYYNFCGEIPTIKILERYRDSDFCFIFTYLSNVARVSWSWTGLRE